MKSLFHWIAWTAGALGGFMDPTFRKRLGSRVEQ